MHPIVLNETQDLEVLNKYKDRLKNINKDKRNYILMKRDFFFKFLLPTKEIQNVCMDEEASYSVTEAQLAEQVSEIIYQSYNNINTITDATACVGGNTISFMFHFNQVNSIEFDETKAKYLYHNVKLVSDFYKHKKMKLVSDFYKHKKIGKVLVYHGDSSNEILNKQDAVFFDPPWGGPEYKKNDDNTLHLFLSGRDIEEICAKYAQELTKLIALKVPYNFAFTSFERAMPNNFTITYHDLGEDKSQKKWRPKFVLIICKIKHKFPNKPLCVC